MSVKKWGFFCVCEYEAIASYTLHTHCSIEAPSSSPQPVSRSTLKHHLDNMSVLKPGANQKSHKHWGGAQWMFQFSKLAMEGLFYLFFLSHSSLPVNSNCCPVWLSLSTQQILCAAEHTEITLRGLWLVCSPECRRPKLNLLYISH